MQSLLLRPLDVLYLRGNKIFGDPGSHAQALMPPWPSLAAGALRSRMLADAGADLTAFANNETILAEPLQTILGTPSTPGTFTVRHFGIALVQANGTVEALMPLPADLIVRELAAGQKVTGAEYLRPRPLPKGVIASHPLCAEPGGAMPTLCADAPSKTKGGLWLSARGFSQWIAGQPVDGSELIESHSLWLTDDRLGIALDPEKRSAADGKIYTTETVAMRNGPERETMFLVQVDGADDRLPATGLVRFGGDGRAAAISATQASVPQPQAADWTRIGTEKRFRLMLTSPGLFEAGWHPRLPDGVSARLVSACATRSEIVSGWDLAQRMPKPAHRVAPAGSVYWFDGFQGDVEALQALCQYSLPFPETDEDLRQDAPQRRAEGFNRCVIAPWAEDH